MSATKSHKRYWTEEIREMVKKYEIEKDRLTGIFYKILRGIKTSNSKNSKSYQVF